MARFMIGTLHHACYCCQQFIGATVQRHVRRREAVAVGAEEGEVLEAVVVLVSVHVVKRQRQGLVSPRIDAAFLAAITL